MQSPFRVTDLSFELVNDRPKPSVHSHDGLFSGAFTVSGEFTAHFIADALRRLRSEDEARLKRRLDYLKARFGPAETRPGRLSLIALAVKAANGLD